MFLFAVPLVAQRRCIIAKFGDERRSHASCCQLARREERSLGGVPDMSLKMHGILSSHLIGHLLLSDSPLTAGTKLGTNHHDAQTDTVCSVRPFTNRYYRLFNRAASSSCDRNPRRRTLRPGRGVPSVGGGASEPAALLVVHLRQRDAWLGDPRSTRMRAIALDPHQVDITREHLRGGGG